MTAPRSLALPAPEGPFASGLAEPDPLRDDGPTVAGAPCPRGAVRFGTGGARSLAFLGVAGRLVSAGGGGDDGPTVDGASCPEGAFDLGLAEIVPCCLLGLQGMRCVQRWGFWGWWSG